MAAARCWRRQWPAGRPFRPSGAHEPRRPSPKLAQVERARESCGRREGSARWRNERPPWPAGRPSTCRPARPSLGPAECAAKAGDKCSRRRRSRPPLQPPARPRNLAAHTPACVLSSQPATSPARSQIGSPLFVLVKGTPAAKSQRVGGGGCGGAPRSLASTSGGSRISARQYGSTGQTGAGLAGCKPALRGGTGDFRPPMDMKIFPNHSSV